MSGETEKQISGWTVDTLKEYLESINVETDKRNEQRFLAQQKAVQDALISQEKAVGAALAASEKAVLVAEANAEKWRANANEWRGSMDDREKNFASRIELGALKERMDLAQGKGVGLNSMWAFIVAGAGIVIPLIAVVITFVAKGH